MNREKYYMEYKSGFTFRAALSAIYATVIFIPALIYLQLVAGQSFGVSWFMLILWVEISRLYGARLTRQEAFLIYMLAGIEFLPTGLLYRQWFRIAPIVQRFGIADLLPTWWVPPAGSPVYTLRTFFHQDWLIPISIVISWAVLSDIICVTLGLFARELYVEVEDLPFPMEEVSAVAITSMTSEERRPIQILSFSAVFGFIWGFIVYALPFIMQAYTGTLVWFIPVPWIDVTRYIEIVLPGAALGLSTSLGSYATGLVVPFNAAIGILIGSLAIYTIGNWLIVSYNLAPDVDPITPGYQSWWIPGMDISLIAQRSIMYFWFPITIGLAFAAGIGPIIHRPRLFTSAIRRIFTMKYTGVRRRTDPIPANLVISIAIISLVCGVALFAVLAPSYLLIYPWISSLMIFFPIFATLVGGRIRGETGISPSFHIGELRNMIFLATNAPIEVWFAPNPMHLQGTGWLRTFKVAQLTETSVKSLIKAYFVLLPFTILMAFIYLELFWRMGPIPSARYPAAQLLWPIDATYTVMWIRGVQMGLFNPMWIVYSLIIGTLLYLAIHIPNLSLLSYAGIAAGIGTLPPYAVAYFIGGVISKIAEARLGEDRWRFYSRLIAGGLTMGESIAITISVSISLIINSIWILPI